MTPISTLLQFGIVTGTMLLVASVAIIGPGRLRALGRTFPRRLRSVAPHVVALLLVLGVNSVARTVGAELSWLINWNITGSIHGLEGNLVAHLQSIATPALTAYFSFVYIFGYAFLLLFPFLAYLAIDDPRPFREAALSYGINYSLGLVAYVLFVSYGPRNFTPDLVQSLLYTTYPQSQLLTREVNVNTNVFPSLHTSLSVTVALLAWRTRDVYGRWVPIAALFAGSIVLATMYLGIHWATDVVAGVALAAVSVHLAREWSDDVQRAFDRAVERIVTLRSGSSAGLGGT